MFSPEVIQSAIFIAVALLVCAGLWYMGYRKQVKWAVLQMVISAEEYWMEGTGRIKYMEVMHKIYTELPWVIRVFMTEEQAKNLIEWAVDEMKLILSDDKTIYKGQIIRKQEQPMLRS